METGNASINHLLFNANCRCLSNVNYQQPNYQLINSYLTFDIYFWNIMIIDLFLEITLLLCCQMSLSL